MVLLIITESGLEIEFRNLIDMLKDLALVTIRS